MVKNMPQSTQDAPDLDPFIDTEEIVDEDPPEERTNAYPRKREVLAGE